MHAPKFHSMIDEELDRHMKHLCEHGLNRADIEVMHTLVHIEEWLSNLKDKEPHTYHGGMSASHGLMPSVSHNPKY